MLANKKMLVLGASGMVGQSLCSFLEINDYSKIYQPKRAELDLLSQNQVYRYFQKNKFDIVILLAAKVGGIQANIKDPVGFYLENTLIGTNIVKAALDAEVSILLNIASSCMYPKNREKLHENDLLTGALESTNEGYALAKIGTTAFCRYVNQQYKLNFKTLIPCNLYGPFDNFDPVSSHMIPGVIRKLHESKEARKSVIDIWGNGEARREFMYVDDLSQCILKALENIDCLPEIMNVGMGVDYSINEYYKVIAEVIGYMGEYKHDLSRPVGMKKKLLDTQQALEWGWQALTPLKVGIEKTYQYFLRNYT
ncbi:GDP-L-fucose synthase [Piscirickettsia salmonis]|uniref:GDP-L-fucose synthase family protein n=1 Tax=Piscirickettsia salmonis TaxID=1238 RepID=UPI0012BABE7B|nr:GDP-L-fucose synthase [Piscirickettsia salmonis]QGP56141.1 GDP-L-fucose synthase [Piscirickettsia salmonis]QGP57991.1 GDP-L-fucose synthase [Piscirickettsia salmonis]QGP65710.1 GDP-L-fucose synthase [Piscirickettsia salmonis]